MRTHVVAVAAVAAVAALAGPACPRDAAPAAPASSSSSPATPTPASAATPAGRGPEYTQDDADAAFRGAREGGKVVFVDGWAPWCHTCLAMQRDVLGDASLARYQDRIVFASVDTDRPEAASFVARFPLRSWPTFFVIDPSTDRVLAEHAGSLSLPELIQFIDAALVARDPTAAADPEVRALLEGHAAMGKKEYAFAAQRYVAAANLKGKRLPEAALGAMRAFAAAKDDAGCLAFGSLAVGAFTTSSSTSDLIGYLTTCASHLPDGDARKGAALTAARAVLEPLTLHPPAGASVDDRADALSILADIAEAQKDTAAFKAAHEKRLKLLDDDAAAQKTVEAARVYDYARMNSDIALGRGDDAVKMLTERTQQLPSSYEAWARLASALHQLKRDVEARPAAEKAIELSYGPRRLRYRTLLADVCAAQKDLPGERKALEALIADAEKLPLPQRDDAALTTAKARLAKLPTAL